MNKESKMISTGTIEFPNVSCLGLWRAEITGQLSDGMWENTAPYDHWKFWSDLDSAVGGCRVVTEQAWRCKKTGYNIAGLYKYVGNRMVQFGRMGAACQTLGIFDPPRNFIEAGEHLSEMTLEEFKQKKADGSWKHSWVAEKMKYVDDLTAETFYATKYTMKDLKKDVAFIKAAMWTVKR